jgi:hypothetical protein
MCKKDPADPKGVRAMDDQLRALLKGLKEVEDAQRKADAAAGRPPAPAKKTQQPYDEGWLPSSSEPEKKPEPEHDWRPAAPEPVEKPAIEPRRGGLHVPLPKGAEKLDRELEKKVSVGDVMRKKKVYGRDNFRDED